MEEHCVNKDGSNGCKREAIGQSERGGEEQRRICLILCQIQSKILAQYLGNVIQIPSIIVALGVTNRKVWRVPCIGVLNTNSSDDEKQNHADKSVRDSMPGWDQGAVSIGADLCPVKGNWQERYTSPSSEKLVDNNVVGTNPAGKAEDTEERSDEARKPIPAEGSREYEKEVFVA